MFGLADEPSPAGERGKPPFLPVREKAELEAEIRRRPLVEKAAKLFGPSVDVLERPSCSETWNLSSLVKQAQEMGVAYNRSTKN